MQRSSGLKGGYALTSTLVADIGGTNARFAFAHTSKASRPTLTCIDTLKCADFSNVSDAIQCYLSTYSHEGRPEQACFAVAAPVSQDRIDFTNNHWAFSTEELAKHFSFHSFHVINDFEAIAHSLTHLTNNDWLNVGGVQLSTVDNGKPKKQYAVVGPGTGFGVAGLSVKGASQEVLVTEAGHMGLSPGDEIEVALFKILMHRFQRVTIGHVLSGPGIVNLYQAMAELHDVQCESLSSAEIGAAALDDSRPMCRETLSLFCRILGRAAGDIALAMWAMDGIYLAGGILPKYSGFLSESSFRAIFEDKAPYQDEMKKVPTMLIHYPDPGLLGAAICMDNRAA